MGLDFSTRCAATAGVLSGATTNTAKLANSDYPSLACADACPLIMLLRILIAQMAVLWLV